MVLSYGHKFHKDFMCHEVDLSSSHKLITTFLESEKIGYKSDNYLLTYTL